MATVDGLTKARMLAIEAASIVSGLINGSGHLILSRFDGETVDAGYALVAVPDATTTTKGVVELATATEVLTGTDDTRSVTPASMLGGISTDKLANGSVTTDKLLDGAVTSGKIANGTIVAEDLASNAVTTAKIVDSNVTTDKIADGAVSSIKIANATILTDDIATATLASSLFGIPGEIRLWSGSTAPTGWLICNGAAISRTTYATLYGITGTLYGVGDGSTTFNVPNLKGRVPVGYDATQTEFDTIGESGGSKTHTLTIPEIPQHNHSITVVGSASIPLQNTAWPSGFNPNNNGTWPSSAAGNTGGGGAHNNIQPYLTIQYIIKT